MDEVLYGDPYPVYRRMRAEDPVYYVEEYDAWFLSRFEDIWRAGPDYEHFTATEGTTPPHLLTKDTPLNLSFASMDPPSTRSTARRWRACSSPARCGAWNTSCGRSSRGSSTRSSSAASATSCRTSPRRCRCAARSR